ncbi:NB-ARC domain-containing protein [Kitasatospora sp. NPDC057692]|uniref:NB-ARC domain-containing protein n=1 Tax=Kitasatospora sp. NPDC057692 TaxID=3346215 RepID=UPI0036BC8B9A
MTVNARPDAGMPEPEPFAQRPQKASPVVGGGNPHTEQRTVVLTPEAEAAARSIAAPPGSHNLPPSPTAELVGRAEALEAVGDALAGGGGLVTQATTLHGLGGVGKTALALHYAYAHLPEYDLVWWITAESPEQIAEAFADLAVHLNRDRALAESPNRQVEWALAWLRAHERWLLVFDNVEDPVHLTPFLGRLLGRGHQLVTSRRADGWHEGIDPIRVDVLDAPLAARLLHRAAGRAEEGDEDEHAEARGLADELGHLPIALAQAGAHIRQTGTSFRAFRELLRTVAPSSSGAMPSALDTVSRLWRTTLRTVQETAPFAVELLRTLAWYAPEALPREALLPFGSRRPEEVDAALEVLADYSLVTLGPRTVAVHRLLRSTLRAGDEDGKVWARAERNLAGAVARLWPQADQAVRRALLPHVRELTTAGRGSPDPTRETVELYRLAAAELAAPEQRVFVIPLVTAVIMYFWCHGQFVSTGAAYAQLTVRLSDPMHIDAELVRRLREDHQDVPEALFRPFVLLNACFAGQSAEAELEHLGRALVELGASGVLGPQIEIPQVFGAEYAFAFLDLYLAGQATAGEITWRLARDFADVHRNPLALTYSLHCGIDSMLELTP